MVCPGAPPWWTSGKEPAYQCRRNGLSPWSGKIPQAGEKLKPVLNYWAYGSRTWELQLPKNLHPRTIAPFCNKIWAHLMLRHLPWQNFWTPRTNNPQLLQDNGYYQRDRGSEAKLTDMLFKKKLYFKIVLKIFQIKFRMNHWKEKLIVEHVSANLFDLENLKDEHLQQPPSESKT